jgi:enamine deaminase RidA (YjgF/YER057c/UK114 family)
MSAEERLSQLGIDLPSPPDRKVGNFVSTKICGGFLYVSGHGPSRDGEYLYCGKVQSAISVSTAREAARLTVLNALASVRRDIGSLDRVTEVVKLLGMVNSDPDFEAQPRVVDGASDLLVEIFGERGRHSRSAVGVAALPFGICVEIEMVLGVG